MSTEGRRVACRDGPTRRCDNNARMVELVDTRDLKSLGLWPCRFKPGSGHQEYVREKRFHQINGETAFLEIK